MGLTGFLVPHAPTKSYNPICPEPNLPVNKKPADEKPPALTFPTLPLTKPAWQPLELLGENKVADLIVTPCGILKFAKLKTASLVVSCHWIHEAPVLVLL